MNSTWFRRQNRNWMSIMQGNESFEMLGYISYACQKKWKKNDIVMSNETILFLSFFNEWENCTPLKWHIESLPCARYLLKERGSFSQNWNQMISRDFAYHFDMSNSPLPSKFKGYFKAMYRDILIWFLFRDGSINKFI